MGNICTTNSSNDIISKDVGDQQPSGLAPMPSTQITSRVALGCGCYWGTEKFVKKDFQRMFPNSIKRARVGFMSPDENPLIKNPSYEQVCTGSSGHVEVLYVELNDPEKHFEALIRFFFQFHDPTTLNKQGNDSGFQYSSCIFCNDEEQKAIANRVLTELQSHLKTGKIRCFTKKVVTTKIWSMMKFTEAGTGHQEYLQKNPSGYCNHRLRFKDWPVPEPP